MNRYDLQVGQFPKIDERRLSTVAQKAVSRLLIAWGCSDRDAARLLSMDADRWTAIASKNFEGAMTQEQLVRVSFLVGIFSGLQVFSQPISSAWPNLPNTGPLFLGKTPVQFMIEGGVDAMEKVRDHVASLGF